MRRLLLAIALTPVIGACASLDSAGISYPKGGDARLFVWGSNYSAGVGTQNGMCVQAATTARASTFNADARANVALLAAFAPALAALPQGEAARLTAGLSQSVMLTNATNGQTAYANIAYFYLCQISLNRQFNEEAVMAMWSDVTRAIPSIGLENTGTASLQAPRQENPAARTTSQVQPVDQANSSIASSERRD